MEAVPGTSAEDLFLWMSYKGCPLSIDPTTAYNVASSYVYGDHCRSSLHAAMQLSRIIAVIAFASVAVCLPRASAAAYPCQKLIDQSTERNFDWQSPTALAMAQCLQSQRMPTPPFSSCIFYTASSRDQAIAYGTATNRTTIYDVYDPKLFDRSAWPAKNWDDVGHIRDLFRITSKAYAMSCTGEAHLILPDGLKDEEVCRESIWVTDEYEVIRSGDSGIILPIWRVSWREVEKGVWAWIREKLQALGVKAELRRRVLRSASEQEVLEPNDDVRSRINEKMVAMKQQWGWHGLEDGTLDDLWALKSGMCGR